MTTDRDHTGAAPGMSPVAPEELLASRDRIAHHRARAARALGRGRARRRFLPQIVAVTAVVATLGAADRFVQGAVASTTPTASAGTVGAGTSATALTLSQVTKTLAADQQAIVALARAQARLAASAGGDGGGAATGGGAQLSSLPGLAAVPNIAVPAITPTVSGTTGASVVVP